jgi:hypothetical protein
MTIQTTAFALCGVLVAQSGYTQSRPGFELEGGAGYAFAGGRGSPGPRLPTFDVASVVWLGDRWGIAIRFVEGPGEDLRQEPITDLHGTTFLGLGSLHYSTATARYRTSLSSFVGLELGVGLMFEQQIASIRMAGDPQRRVTEPENGPRSGFSTEALVTLPIAHHFAIKAGGTYEFDFEGNHLQPVALAAIRF